MTPARAAVLERVAASVLARPPLGTVRVGIDGVDGAGKTMFGDELRDRPAPSGRPVNIYFRECEPWQHASIVIDNDDLAAPFIVSSEHSREPGR